MSTPFEVEPLSSTHGFGKVIRGLKAPQLADAAVQDRLRHHWIEDGLVVFRDCDTSEDFHLNLSRVFGALELHPSREYRSAASPEFITIESTPRADRPEFEMNGDVGFLISWHKDLVYVDKINHGGILRALTPSVRGGRTGFIDGVEAYNRLPENMKTRLEGLRVVYRVAPMGRSPYETRSPIKIRKYSDSMKKLFNRIDDFPPVSHPLVFTHAESGRKVLNLSPAYARHIEGLPEGESHELLQMLTSHLFDSPAYYHSWQENELLLWDNWRMLHMVTLTALDEDRVMQRTTIAGDYGFGRTLPLSAAPALS